MALDAQLGARAVEEVEAISEALQSMVTRDRRLFGQVSDLLSIYLAVPLT
jgi:hypothetical protein